MDAPEPGSPVPLVVEVPLPPGTSPFHVKGHVYQKMRDDSDRALGPDVLGPSLDDPRVRAFWEQTFYAGAWYDALPLTPITIAHARLRGLTMYALCREKGRVIAGKDVPGLYRAILRLFSPETLVSRLPRAATFYFDFGTSAVEWMAPNAVRLALRGVPFSLSAVLAGSLEGFCAKSLELSGAVGVSVRTLEVVYDGGAVSGVPTACIRYEASWTR